MVCLKRVLVAGIASALHANAVPVADANPAGTPVVKRETTLVSEGCNPLLEVDCPPVKALATSIADDFTSESDNYHIVSFEDQVTYDEDGLTMTLAERWDNPSLKSNFYIMFGKVEVVLKAAPGQGVISSFYLQSDDLDEIDLEWFGGDQYEVQTNFFSKGNTSTYDRGGYHNIPDPTADFHNYTIDWNYDKLTFYFDGTVIRELLNNTSSGYPQSPMYLRTGIWAGGDPSNAPGTIEWAGGLTDYTQAPFSMHIKHLVVSDYSSGSEYRYTDQSGAWTSIEAVDGKVLGRVDQANEEFARLVSGQSLAHSSTTSSSSSSSSSPSSSTSSSSASSSSVSSSSTHSPSSSSSFSTHPSSSSSSSSTIESSSSSSSSSHSSTLTTTRTNSTTSESPRQSTTSSEVSSTTHSAGSSTTVHTTEPSRTSSVAAEPTRTSSAAPQAPEVSSSNGADGIISNFNAAYLIGVPLSVLTLLMI